MNFVILPNLIALAALVAIFWAISHKATSERLRLWLAGWSLVLLHFAVEFLSPAKHFWGRPATGISLGSLLLAGIAFLISVVNLSGLKQELALALALAVPALAYIAGAVSGAGNWIYYAAVVMAAVLAPSLCLRNQLYGRKLWLACVTAGGTMAVLLVAWAAGRAVPQLGPTVLLASLNFAIAILYALCYRRATVGVVTTVIGFVLWCAAFPAPVLLRTFASHLHLSPQAWNIPAYVVAVGMILTLLEDQIAISQYHAYHDEMTGLPNRRLLEDRLGLALAHARRSRTKLAVFQLDLDRFKEVNDTYGHRTGDLVLQEVAGRLATCIRNGDTLARSGGDEFTVISQVEDRNGAAGLMAALETALSIPIVMEDRQVQTGLSIGVALYPDDGINADKLHASADHAMYMAKRAGRSGPADEALTQASLSS